MIENPNYHHKHGPEAGVQTDKIVNLIEHMAGKYGDNKPLYGKIKEDLIKGVPVATGTAVGMAVVIDSPEDLKRVGPDTILVCHRMSSAYSIVFHRVQGIISERGGAMSSAATVARENALPAVTGVHAACEIISDGDIIEIDGNNGHVHILSKALPYTA